ncbi:MAG: hypothetical protein KA118_16630 [Verrucomicrobia bacterium]|nr:hypothetical protein [Verrucomicrobiota bacterium]
MTTPDLPAFAPLFAQQLQELRAATQAALHQFQALFEVWIPPYRLAQQDEGPLSRKRLWNLRLVALFALATGMITGWIHGAWIVLLRQECVNVSRGAG